MTTAFKKGPVSLAERAEVEIGYAQGDTVSDLSARLNRSPKVIEKVLQDLAMRPTLAPARVVRLVLEFPLQDCSIQLPNGVQFTLGLPVGLDSTNNSAMLEQIQVFLESKEVETEDRLTEKESALYA